MIGNDIVDLKLAAVQSNWKRKGFLDKIFTNKEQDLILNAKDPSIMVWLLWSMKESAYKIYMRQNSLRIFAPKRFECDVNTSQNTVKINEILYFTSSTISKDSIHTIARLNLNTSIRTNYFKMKNDSYTIQHNTTYNSLKEGVTQQFDIPISKIEINKNKMGIPYINELSKVSISISHHGIFGAYAFEFIEPSQGPKIL